MRIIPSFCEKASLYNAANKAGGAKASQSGGVGAKFCKCVNIFFKDTILYSKSVLISIYDLLSTTFSIIKHL